MLLYQIFNTNNGTKKKICTFKTKEEADENKNATEIIEINDVNL